MTSENKTSEKRPMTPDRVVVRRTKKNLKLKKKKIARRAMF